MTYTPYQIEGEARKGRFLVTCDHATNTVPPDLGGTLGLPEADMARHIAYCLASRLNPTRPFQDLLLPSGGRAHARFYFAAQWDSPNPD